MSETHNNYRSNRHRIYTHIQEYDDRTKNHDQTIKNRTSKKHRQQSKSKKSNSKSKSKTHHQFKVKKFSSNILNKLISLLGYTIQSADKAMQYIPLSTYFDANFQTRLYYSDRQNLLNWLNSLNQVDLKSCKNIHQTTLQTHQEIYNDEYYTLNAQKGKKQRINSQFLPNQIPSSDKIQLFTSTYQDFIQRNDQSSGQKRNFRNSLDDKIPNYFTCSSFQSDRNFQNINLDNQKIILQEQFTQQIKKDLQKLKRQVQQLKKLKKQSKSIQTISFEQKINIIESVCNNCEQKLSKKSRENVNIMKQNQKLKDKKRMYGEERYRNSSQTIQQVQRNQHNQNKNQKKSNKIKISPDQYRHFQQLLKQQKQLKQIQEILKQRLVKGYHSNININSPLSFNRLLSQFLTQIDFTQRKSQHLKQQYDNLQQKYSDSLKLLKLKQKQLEELEKKLFSRKEQNSYLTNNFDAYNDQKVQNQLNNKISRLQTELSVCKNNFKTFFVIIKNIILRSAVAKDKINQNTSRQLQQTQVKDGKVQNGMQIIIKVLQHLVAQNNKLRIQIESREDLCNRSFTYIQTRIQKTVNTQILDDLEKSRQQLEYQSRHRIPSKVANNIQTTHQQQQLKKQLTQIKLQLQLKDQTIIKLSQLLQIKQLQLTKIKIHIQKQQQHKSQAQKIIDSQSYTLQELKYLLDEKENQLKRTKNDLQIRQDQIKDLDKYVNKLQNHAIEIRQQNSKLKQSLQEMQRQSEIINDEKGSLLEYVNKMQKKQKKLDDLLYNRENEIEQLKKMLQEYEEGYRVLEERYYEEIQDKIQGQLHNNQQNRSAKRYKSNSNEIVIQDNNCSDKQNSRNSSPNNKIHSPTKTQKTDSPNKQILSKIDSIIHEKDNQIQLLKDQNAKLEEKLENNLELMLTFRNQCNQLQNQINALNQKRLRDQSTKNQNLFDNLKTPAKDINDLGNNNQQKLPLNIGRPFIINQPQQTIQQRPQRQEQSSKKTNIQNNDITSTKSIQTNNFKDPQNDALNQPHIQSIENIQSPFIQQIQNQINKWDQNDKAVHFNPFEKKGIMTENMDGGKEAQNQQVVDGQQRNQHIITISKCSLCDEKDNIINNQQIQKSQLYQKLYSLQTQLKQLEGKNHPIANLDTNQSQKDSNVYLKYQNYIYQQNQKCKQCDCNNGQQHQINDKDVNPTQPAVINDQLNQNDQQNHQHRHNNNEDHVDQQIYYKYQNYRNAQNKQRQICQQQHHKIQNDHSQEKQKLNDENQIQQNNHDEHDHNHINPSFNNIDQDTYYKYQNYLLQQDKRTNNCDQCHNSIKNEQLEQKYDLNNQKNDKQNQTDQIDPNTYYKYQNYLLEQNARTNNCDQCHNSLQKGENPIKVSDNNNENRNNINQPTQQQQNINTSENHIDHNSQNPNEQFSPDTYYKYQNYINKYKQLVQNCDHNQINDRETINKDVKIEHKAQNDQNKNSQQQIDPNTQLRYRNYLLQQQKRTNQCDCSKVDDNVVSDNNDVSKTEKNINTVNIEPIDQASLSQNQQINDPQQQRSSSNSANRSVIQINLNKTQNKPNNKISKPNNHLQRHHRDNINRVQQPTPLPEEQLGFVEKVLKKYSDYQNKDQHIQELQKRVKQLEGEIDKLKQRLASNQQVCINHHNDQGQKNDENASNSNNVQSNRQIGIPSSNQQLIGMGISLHDGSPSKQTENHNNTQDKRPSTLLNDLQIQGFKQNGLSSNQPSPRHKDKLQQQMESGLLKRNRGDRRASYLVYNERNTIISGLGLDTDRTRRSAQYQQGVGRAGDNTDRTDKSIEDSHHSVHSQPQKIQTFNPISLQIPSQRRVKRSSSQSSLISAIDIDVNKQFQDQQFGFQQNEDPSIKNNNPLRKRVNVQQFSKPAKPSQQNLMISPKKQVKFMLSDIRQDSYSNKQQSQKSGQINRQQQQQNANNKDQLTLQDHPNNFSKSTTKPEQIINASKKLQKQQFHSQQKILVQKACLDRQTLQSVIKQLLRVINQLRQQKQKLSKLLQEQTSKNNRQTKDNITGINHSRQSVKSIQGRYSVTNDNSNGKDRRASPQILKSVQRPFIRQQTSLQYQQQISSILRKNQQQAIQSQEYISPIINTNNKGQQIQQQQKSSLNENNNSLSLINENSNSNNNEINKNGDRTLIDALMENTDTMLKNDNDDNSRKQQNINNKKQDQEQDFNIKITIMRIDSQDQQDDENGDKKQQTQDHKNNGIQDNLNEDNENQNQDKVQSNNTDKSKYQYEQCVYLVKKESLKKTPLQNKIKEHSQQNSISITPIQDYIDQIIDQQPHQQLKKNPIAQQISQPTNNLNEQIALLMNQLKDKQFQLQQLKNLYNQTLDKHNIDKIQIIKQLQRLNEYLNRRNIEIEQRDGEVVRLRQAIEQGSKIIQEQKQVISENMKKIDQLEQSNRILLDRNGELTKLNEQISMQKNLQLNNQTQIQQLKSANEDLNNQILELQERLKSQCNQYEHKIRQNQKRINQCQKKNSGLIKQLEGLKTKHTDILTQLQTLRKQFNAQKQQLEDQINANRLLTQQYDIKQSSNGDLQAQLDGLRSQLSTINQKIKSLQNNNKRLDNELKNKNLQITRKTQLVSKQSKEIQSVKQQLQGLKNQLQNQRQNKDETIKLQKSMKRQKQQDEKLKQQMKEKIISLIKIITDNYSSLKQQSNRRLQEQKNHKQQLKSKDQNIKQLQKDIFCLTQQKQTLERQLNRPNNQIKQLNQKINQLNQQINKLNQTNKELKQPRNLIRQNVQSSTKSQKVIKSQKLVKNMNNPLEKMLLKHREQIMELHKLLRQKDQLLRSLKKQLNTQDYDKQFKAQNYKNQSLYKEQTSSLIKQNTANKTVTPQTTRQPTSPHKQHKQISALQISSQQNNIQVSPLKKRVIQLEQTQNNNELFEIHNFVKVYVKNNNVLNLKKDNIQVEIKHFDKNYKQTVNSGNAIKNKNQQEGQNLVEGNLIAYENQILQVQESRRKIAQIKQQTKRTNNLNQISSFKKPEQSPRRHFNNSKPIQNDKQQKSNKKQQKSRSLSADQQQQSTSNLNNFYLQKIVPQYFGRKNHSLSADRKITR